MLAVALLAIIGIVFLSALRTISLDTGVYEERVMAERLAQSQIELIKVAPYRSVSLPDGTPPGYNITIAAAENVTGEQQINEDCILPEDELNWLDLEKRVTFKGSFIITVAKGGQCGTG